MKTDTLLDYSVYRQFTEQYIAGRFLKINRQDSFMIQMEELLSRHNQFFYVADLVRLKILFTSKGSESILGVIPDEFDLSTFISRTHSEDQHRYALARTKLINLGQEIFIKRDGEVVLSSHFRLKNSKEIYSHLLFQGHVFYSSVHDKTVYVILVMTDLSGFNIGRNGHHFYVGDDLNNFRFPDDELLRLGKVFSDREFEILKLIAVGLDSDQISDQLFLSVHTVNTHRRNILKKTNKTNTHDLVLELREKGVL